MLKMLLSFPVVATDHQLPRRLSRVDEDKDDDVARLGVACDVYISGGVDEVVSDGLDAVCRYACTAESTREFADLLESAEHREQSESLVALLRAAVKEDQALRLLAVTQVESGRCGDDHAGDRHVDATRATRDDQGGGHDTRGDRD